MEARNAELGFVISVYLEFREPTQVPLPLAMNTFISRAPDPKKVLILAKHYFVGPSYLALGSRGWRGTTSHPYILSQNLHWCLYKRPVTRIILDLSNAMDKLGNAKPLS